MSEIKHTPGPWEQVRYGNRQHEIQGPNGEIVGRVHEPDERYSLLANARLVAAAPEMLEALRECVTAYEQHRGAQPTGRYWSAPNHIFHARAAIAKATGDQT